MELIVRINKQDSAIGNAVHQNQNIEDIGAGDQGHMFG